MPGGGTDEILYDYRLEHDDGAIEEVYVRRTSDSETYPSGVHYRFYFGYPDEDVPILQFDNGHGGGEHHEHTRGGVEQIEFVGIHELLLRFQEVIDDHDTGR